MGYEKTIQRDFQQARVSPEERKKKTPETTSGGVPDAFSKS
jgi:hypothetical protein